MIANFFYWIVSEFVFSNILGKSFISFKRLFGAILIRCIANSVLSSVDNSVMKKYRKLVLDWIYVIAVSSILYSLKYQHNYQVNIVHLIPTLMKISLLFTDYKLLNQKLTVEINAN